MMFTLMKMILKLLFLSDLWHDVRDLSNIKHLKQKHLSNIKHFKQKIYVFGIASYKIVGFVHVREWEKKLF